MNVLRKSNSSPEAPALDAIIILGPTGSGKTGVAIEIAKEIDELLPDCFNKICFELGLRYYMDYISHDEHFKEIYPGYRLDRAKSLLEVRW